MTSNDATPKTTILSITSYALKGPPLDFTPDVHLNARRLINPPSQLRKAFDGRCEGLRKNLRADPAFQELLDEVKPKIFAVEHDKRGLLLDDEDEGTKTVEVKVAVACIRGRHRSAAVAEELVLLPGWPEHFDIRLHHRDIDTPHHHQKRHRQNLERERKGETVNIEECVPEDEFEGESSENSNSTRSSDRRRSSDEPTSTKWWDACKEELSKIDSKDFDRPEGLPSLDNPLNLPT